MLDDMTEFKDFDPKKFWSEVNNELVCTRGITKAELEQVEAFLHCLSAEVSVSELIKTTGKSQSKIMHLLGLIRKVNGLSLSRKELKGNVIYRASDLRKNKA